MPFERTQPAPRPFARRLLGARLAERHVATVQVDPASRACSMEPTATRLRAAITTAAQVYDVSTQRDEPVEVQQRRMEIVLAALVNARADGADQPNHGEYKLQIEFARTCIYFELGYGSVTL